MILCLYLALIDRFHGFIEGWYLPRINEDLKLILTVPEGSSITGVQSGAAQPFMTRVVETGSGLALQMRRRPGIAVSFR